MSWGFPEGQAVFAADEANYDNVFNVPGVTFLASTGDYGAADPEFPAFSPNVVAVGGTSLNLGADNSYTARRARAAISDSAGMSIGSGGGFSLVRARAVLPAGSSGRPAAGRRPTSPWSPTRSPRAWIADPYNLGADNPFEVVGGTSCLRHSGPGRVLWRTRDGQPPAWRPSIPSARPKFRTPSTACPRAITTDHQRQQRLHGETGYNLVTGWERREPISWSAT